jgi:hypothetical protein
MCVHGILDSIIGIVTGYGLDHRGVGVLVPVDSRIFYTSSRLALGSTRPPFQWVPGALSPEVNTSTPPIRLHGVVLN